MEYINNKKEVKKCSNNVITSKKREKIQLAMVIGIYLAIILLIIVTIVLVKNIKEIQTDPISYGVDKKGFAICTCYDYEGRSFDYNSEGVIPRKEYGWNFKIPQVEEILE